MTGLSRRRVVGVLAASAAVVGSGPVRAASCLLTPDQATGPFYPAAFGESDADLTRVAGASARAQGETIEVACENCHRAYWYPNEVIPQVPALPEPAPSK